ncbi:MAG: aromatic amino acid ammonia-lyase [Myxococcota bacterium]|nr:aromatic amino acid ammonia-lyase [Myxococcota bacterium]
MAESRPSPLPIDGDHLTLADVVDVARGLRTARLSGPARAQMTRSYEWVREAGKGDAPVYGVNTGFGSLARVPIEAKDRARLSLNLVRSHAAGVGPALPEAVVRAMMLLRANALAKGVSGCRPQLVDTILEMLEVGVTPVVPSQGSCGSSGDLAPLAHLGLVLAAGDHPARAMFLGEEMSAADAMGRAGIARLELEAKDGLAITNGAQLTTAIGALACFDAGRLIRIAEVAAAMSVDALRGATRAFHPMVHRMRPYAGARATAANLRAMLAGSTLVDSVPGKVQDAYSLRCTPQVLGAARDTIAFATHQVTVELNAATDNPLILLDAGPAPEGFAHDPENHAFSAGMFHGEPVGMAMDTLKIAVAEIGSLSERRLYRLTTGSLSQRLPPGLARSDRPELGLMVPQTTAAALVSENKALGWPATMDSIPTCEDQEDHVAMSTTAARRAAEVVMNVRRILAIELLAAANALAFRREEEGDVLQLGAGTGPALATVEAALGGFSAMRAPSDDIAALDQLLQTDALFDGLPALLPVGAVPGDGA